MRWLVLFATLALGCAPRGQHAEPPVLHAAVGGRYVHGAVTQGIAAVLDGAPAAPEVRAHLRQLGLLA